MNALLILAGALALQTSVTAAPVVTAPTNQLNLAWDAVPGAGVTNYVLYAHTNTLTATNLAAATVKAGVGTNTLVAVENLAPGQWSFAVTAVKAGVESPPSNILPVEVPPAPVNLRTVVLQYGATVTNLTDMGYFRLRILP